MMVESPSTRGGQRGFSLPVAAFVVVVLAFLGTMMMTIGALERETATAAAQGARAYYAARSGVEWAIFQTVSPAGPGANCPLAGGNFAPAVDGLNGFNVAVNCAQTLHQEHGVPVRVVVITSVATFGNFGTPDYVSRTLQASVTNAAWPPP